MNTVPDQIGRYRVLSELGRGAMGRVFLALDPNIDRRLALKVFAPQGEIGSAEEEALRRRFLFEARAAGRLKHPGIVTVYDSDTDAASGQSFIAMEWVEGASLKSLLEESGALPPARAVEIAAQVAEALDSAHRQGLVHRDIKPANILLDAEGQAKVSDFGIAKFVSMSQTATGMVLGSPYYMSPEQIRDEEIDGRSDLFSLGVVFYQCLTGVAPFDGDSLPSLTYKILEIDPKPPHAVNPSVPPALSEVIGRALAKSPAARFQTGAEFARALQAARPVPVDEKGLGQSVAPPVPAPTDSGSGAAAETARGKSGTVLLPAKELDETSTEMPSAGQVAGRARRRRRTHFVAAAGLAVVLFLLWPLFKDGEPPDRTQIPGPEVVRSEPPPPETGQPRRRVADGAPPVDRSAGTQREMTEPEPDPVEAALEPARRSPPAVARPAEAPRSGSAEPQTRPAGDSEPGWFQLAVEEDEASPREAPPPRTSEPARGPAVESAPEETATAGPKSSSGEPEGYRAETVPSPVPQGERQVPSRPPSPPGPGTAAPPRDEPVAEAAAVAEPTARLKVEHKNRLKSARLTIWVDGEQVWSRELASERNVFKRLDGKRNRVPLDVTPGEHVVRVRIEGSSGKIGASGSTRGVFREGQTKSLSVVLVPPDSLLLTWKD